MYAILFKNIYMALAKYAPYNPKKLVTLFVKPEEKIAGSEGL